MGLLSSFVSQLELQLIPQSSVAPFPLMWKNSSWPILPGSCPRLQVLLASDMPQQSSQCVAQHLQACCCNFTVTVTLVNQLVLDSLLVHTLTDLSASGFRPHAVQKLRHSATVQNQCRSHVKDVSVDCCSNAEGSAFELMSNIRLFLIQETRLHGEHSDAGCSAWQ